ncbi:AfsR/SARP family transcriptional regulator [Streptomyces sp. PSRA5]|uniref:AfsR/SARP family transcriptional regulator n=1 Tax=Streptomyces panacea TaxID=3035064 RepID=UPI00339CAB15
MSAETVLDTQPSAEQLRPSPAVPTYRLIGAPGVNDADGHRVGPSGMTTTLMAVLLLRSHRVNDSDSLVALLWPGAKPQSARSNLRQYVSRLRRFLRDSAPAGSAVLSSTGGGYLLEVRRGELDITRFEDFADMGRRALEAGEIALARSYLEAATDLWRGPLCQGLVLAPQLETEILYWEDLRVAAHQMLVKTRLHLGDYGRAIAEIRRLLGSNPLSEELWGMLMLAFYRSYRRAEALETYRLARRRVIQDLGVEPTDQLRQLNEHILSGGPPLDSFAWLTPGAPRWGTP